MQQVGVVALATERCRNTSRVCWHVLLLHQHSSRQSCDSPHFVAPGAIVTVPLGHLRHGPRNPAAAFHTAKPPWS